VRRARYDAVLQRGVHVLNERSLGLLTYVSEDGSTLVFGRSVGQLNRIVGGDVIVCDVTPLTPNGLLRRVTEVSRANRQLVLRTEQATLEEVFWRGRVRETFLMAATDVRKVRTNIMGVRVRRLTPEGLIAPRAGSSPEGASALALDIPPDLTWTPDPIEIDLLNVVLFDLDQDLSTTDDQVTVTGMVGVAPTFDIDLNVFWGRVRKFSFTNTNELYSKLELDGHVFVPLLDENVAVATFQFSPIVIMAGPVPIVLTPVLDIKAGALANLTADIHSSVTASVSVTLGAVYENNQWEVISDFPDGLEDIELEWEKPTVELEAYAQAYAGPEFSILVYGIAGPFVSVYGYSELSAVIIPDATWVLFLGLKGNVGLESSVPIIGPPITFPLFDQKWKVAEGSLNPF
jgi:hypothetical protein